jgi:hypothetical protein
VIIEGVLDTLVLTTSEYVGSWETDCDVDETSKQTFKEAVVVDVLDRLDAVVLGIGVA